MVKLQLLQSTKIHIFNIVSTSYPHSKIVENYLLKPYKETISLKDYVENFFT